MMRRRWAKLSGAKRRGARSERRRTFRLEGLESRILLSADLPVAEIGVEYDDSSSPTPSAAFLESLDSSQPSSDGTDGATESITVIDMGTTSRELTLHLDPLTQLLLVLDSSDLARPAFAELPPDQVEQIVVRGTTLDDHLTVDLGPGRAPAVHFDGGLQESPDAGGVGDALSFRGNSGSTSVRFTGADETGFSGEIEADGTRVSFTGLEPIETSATADLRITLPVDASNPDAELRNISGRAGWSELVGSSFENHAFENPTNSLTIVLGDLGDSLTLTSLDPAFAALINVMGGAGADTLTGPNAASGWVLTGTDRGLFGSPGTFVPTTFSGVESIQGGADEDALDVSTGRLTGGFDGGGGADRVTASADADFALDAAQLSVNGRTTGLQSVSVVDLTGGPSDNAFEALDFAGSATLNGGGGEDFFTVRPGNGSAVSVAGGAHDDRVLVLGTAGADDFAVSENGASFSGRSVGLVDVERLDVYGRGGADAFDVTPSASMAVRVDGGDDADELRIDAQGRDIILDETAPIVAGQVKIAGFSPVTYGDTEDVFVLDTDLANGHGPAIRQTITQGLEGVAAQLGAALVDGPFASTVPLSGLTLGDLAGGTLSGATLLADLRDDPFSLADGSDIEVAYPPLDPSVRFEVDFDGATTLGDVLDRLNELTNRVGMPVTFGLNAAHTNLEVRSDREGRVRVRDLAESTLADHLGIDRTFVFTDTELAIEGDAAVEVELPLAQLASWFDDSWVGNRSTEGVRGFLDAFQPSSLPGIYTASAGEALVRILPDSTPQAEFEISIESSITRSLDLAAAEELLREGVSLPGGEMEFDVESGMTIRFTFGSDLRGESFVYRTDEISAHVDDDPDSEDGTPLATPQGATVGFLAVEITGGHVRLEAEASLDPSDLAFQTATYDGVVDVALATQTIDTLEDETGTPVSVFDPAGAVPADAAITVSAAGERVLTLPPVVTLEEPLRSFTNVSPESVARMLAELAGGVSAFESSEFFGAPIPFVTAAGEEIALADVAGIGPVLGQVSLELLDRPLREDTRLHTLNGNRGVDFLSSTGEPVPSHLRIERINGEDIEISFNQLLIDQVIDGVLPTIGDVIDAINEQGRDLATGEPRIEALIAPDGARLLIVDLPSAGEEEELRRLAGVALNGSPAASQLGLVGVDRDDDRILVGAPVVVRTPLFSTVQELSLLLGSVLDGLDPSQPVAVRPTAIYDPAENTVGYRIAVEGGWATSVDLALDTEGDLAPLRAVETLEAGTVGLLPSVDVDVVLGFDLDPSLPAVIASGASPDAEIDGTSGTNPADRAEHPIRIPADGELSGPSEFTLLVDGTPVSVVLDPTGPHADGRDRVERERFTLTGGAISPVDGVLRSDATFALELFAGDTSLGTFTIVVPESATDGTSSLDGTAFRLTDPDDGTLVFDTGFRDNDQVDPGPATGTRLMPQFEPVFQTTTGVLSQDWRFLLSIDRGEGAGMPRYLVELLAADTADNATLEDLAADLRGALASVSRVDLAAQVIGTEIDLTSEIDVVIEGDRLGFETTLSETFERDGQIVERMNVVLRIDSAAGVFENFDRTDLLDDVNAALDAALGGDVVAELQADRDADGNVILVGGDPIERLVLVVDPASAADRVELRARQSNAAAVQLGLGDQLVPLADDIRAVVDLEAEINGEPAVVPIVDAFGDPVTDAQGDPLYSIGLFGADIGDALDHLEDSPGTDRMFTGMTVLFTSGSLAGESRAIEQLTRLGEQGAVLRLATPVQGAIEEEIRFSILDPGARAIDATGDTVPPTLFQQASRFEPVIEVLRRDLQAAIDVGLVDAGLPAGAVEVLASDGFDDPAGNRLAIAASGDDALPHTLALVVAAADDPLVTELGFDALDFNRARAVQPFFGPYFEEPATLTNRVTIAGDAPVRANYGFLGVTANAHIDVSAEVTAVIDTRVDLDVFEANLLRANLFRVLDLQVESSAAAALTDIGVQRGFAALDPATRMDLALDSWLVTPTSPLEIHARGDVSADVVGGMLPIGPDGDGDGEPDRADAVFEIRLNDSHPLEILVLGSDTEDNESLDDLVGDLNLALTHVTAGLFTMDISDVVEFVREGDALRLVANRRLLAEDPDVESPFVAEIVLAAGAGGAASDALDFADLSQVPVRDVELSVSHREVLDRYLDLDAERILAALERGADDFLARLDDVDGGELLAVSLPFVNRPLLGAPNGLIDPAGQYRSILQRVRAAVAGDPDASLPIPAAGNVQDVAWILALAFHPTAFLTPVLTAGADGTSLEFRIDDHLLDAASSPRFALELAALGRLVSETPGAREELRGLFVDVVREASVTEGPVPATTTSFHASLDLPNGGSLAAEDGFYVGMFAERIGVDGEPGELRRIAGYAVGDGTAVFTFDDPFSTAPVAGDRFDVARLPDQLVGAAAEAELAATVTGRFDLGLSMDLDTGSLSTVAGESGLSLAVEVRAPELEDGLPVPYVIGPLSAYAQSPDVFLGLEASVSLGETELTSPDALIAAADVDITGGEARAFLQLSTPDAGTPAEFVRGRITAVESANQIRVLGELSDEAGFYEQWTARFADGRERTVASYVPAGPGTDALITLSGWIPSSNTGQDVELVKPFVVDVPDLAAYLADVAQSSVDSSHVSIQAPDMRAALRAARPAAQINDPEIVTGALDLALVAIQDAITQALRGASLPMIGEGLEDLAPFIANLRVPLLSAYVDVLEEKPSALPPIGDPLRGVAALSEAFVRAFGSPPVVSLDAGDPGDSQDVEAADAIRFDFVFEQELALADVFGTPGFEMGASLRSLDLLLQETPLDIRLGFRLDFGFRFDAERGFSLDTSADDELAIHVDVRLADARPGQREDVHRGLLSDLPMTADDFRPLFLALGAEADDPDPTSDIEVEASAVRVTGVPRIATGTVIEAAGWLFGVRLDPGGDVFSDSLFVRFDGEAETHDVVRVSENVYRFEDTTLSAEAGATFEFGVSNEQVTALLAQLPQDGTIALRLSRAGETVTRNVVAIDADSGTLTLEHALPEPEAFDDPETQWTLGRRSVTRLDFAIDVLDPGPHVGGSEDGRADFAELVAAVDPRHLIDGTLSGDVDLHLHVKTIVFDLDRAIQAPQLRSDLAVEWGFLDRPIFLEEGGEVFDLAAQTAGLSASVFGDSVGIALSGVSETGVPSAVVEAIVDDNERRNTNFLGNTSPIRVEYDGDLSLTDGDLVRIVGARGNSPNQPAPVHIKANGTFRISDVEPGRFTLDGTFGEDVMGNGTPGTREPKYLPGTGQIIVLPRIASFEIENGEVVVHTVTDHGLVDGQQINVVNVASPELNGTFTVASAAGQQLKILDANGNPVVGDDDTSAGPVGYLDPVNAPHIAFKDTQMNLESAFSGTLFPALEHFYENLEGSAWLLSPTEGWLFANDPIFSFIQGTNQRVIDTLQKLAAPLLPYGPGVVLALEIIKQLSPIFGLAERIASVEGDPSGEEIHWIDLAASLDVPDIRGVADIATLFNPQNTPTPGLFGLGSFEGDTDSGSTVSANIVEPQLGYSFSASYESLRGDRSDRPPPTQDNDPQDSGSTIFRLGDQEQDEVADLVDDRSSRESVFFIDGDDESTEDQARENERKRRERRGDRSVDAGPGFSATPPRFEFPILTQPEQAMRMLVGANVDLWIFELPEISLAFDVSAEIMIFPPILLKGNITFSLGLSLNFAFGADTEGFRQFARSADLLNNPGASPDSLSEGNFALDVREQVAAAAPGGFPTLDALKSGLLVSDPAEITLSASLTFGLSIGAEGVFNIALMGGINGGIEFNFHDPDLDGRVRGSELAANKRVIRFDSDGTPMIEPELRGVWDVFGYVEWFFSFSIEVLGATLFEIDPFDAAGIDQTIVDGVIQNFTRAPVPAVDIGGDVLRLNMGPFAADRIHGSTTDHDETFVVRQDAEGRIVVGFSVELDPEAGGGRLDALDSVLFAYENVGRIIAFGGIGDDSIQVIGPLIDRRGNPIPVEFHGGDGDDLLVGGGGDDELFGDAGDDVLVGRARRDTLEGGEGNDTLRGGAGSDELQGGDGDDVLDGGDGNDRLDGGRGNDVTQGGLGGDRHALGPAFGQDTVLERDVFRFERAEPVSSNGNPARVIGPNTRFSVGESLETDPTAEGFAQSIEIREGDVITVSSEGAADREFVVSGDFVDVEVGSGERITIVHATPSRDSLDFGRMRDGVVVTTRVVDGIAQVVAEDRHGNSVTHSHPGQSQIERFAGGFGVDEMRIFAIPEAGLSVDGRGRGDTFVVEMDGGEDLRGTLRVRDTGFPFSTDRLIVNGTAGDDTVGITDEQVLLGAPVFSTVVFGEGSGLELIRANLRAGDDQAFLYSSLGTLAVEVNGEDGDDVILAGSGPELGRDTRLADLGNGGGIFRDLLSPELIVTLAGTELAPISIDFDLAVTLGDVIDAVEAHDELELDFNETGNGLILRASVPGARVQVARTLAAVQLGLRLDVEETSVTLDENPVEHTLTLAPGDEIEINGEAVTISIGAELILGEGDELSVDGVTLDLHGDTSLLFDQTATDALAEPVQFLRDGPLEFFFIDDGDRLTLNVPPLLTIDDGVSGVASFEFDDGFLYVNAPEGIRVPIRADAVETADALAARIGHALSEGLLDLELVVDAVDPNVLHIGTLADGTPAFSSTSDAIGFSSASSLEGLHIYARGPGGTLNELDGNGFDGPIRLTGGGQEAVTPGDPSHGYDVLVLDDSGDVAANTGILGGTRLTGLGIGEGIHYSGLEIVDLRLGRAEDTLLIESTDPRAVTRVSGGGADDAIAIDMTDPSDPTEPPEERRLLAPELVGALVVYGDHPTNPQLAPEADPLTFAIAPVLDAPPGEDTITADRAAEGLIVYGGPMDDVITGSGFGDWLLGGSGDDEIRALAGDDRVWGDSGVDVDLRSFVTTLDVGLPDLVAGGPFVTVTTAGGDGDTNATGSDLLHGGDGADILLGDHGQIFGQHGDIDPASGSVEATGSAGGDDEIHGDAGDDLVLAGFGSDGPVRGELGNDVLLGDIGTITSITYVEGALSAIATIVSTGAPSPATSDDALYGDAGHDVVFGSAGADTVEGGAGHDILLGDNGVVSDLGFDASGASAGRIAAGVGSGTEAVGGADTMLGNAGNDILIGGIAGDVMRGGNAADPVATEDLDTLVGDSGEVLSVESLAPRRIAWIRTTDTAAGSGGDDTIHGDEQADAILGGVGRDTIAGNDGADMILGDNGEFVSDADLDLATLDHVTTLDPDLGDADEIHGGAGNDLLIGGSAGDAITGDGGNDLVLGDHAIVDRDVADAASRIDLSQLPLTNLAKLPFRYTAIDTAAGDGGGDDVIHGNEGHDILLGQQGDDAIFGNAGNDDLIGGHNVAGGTDEQGLADGDNDELDGGAGRDVIAGDNATIQRKQDVLDPRYRALQGTLLHDANGDTQQAPDALPDPLGDAAQFTGRAITLLDHDDSPVPGTFGNDVIAGGGDDDVLLGQLGDDVIQGDGATSLGAGAGRDAQGLLVVAPSVENAGTDGDDYIEGNGGNDVVFGNLGQDDIVGGSSEFYGVGGPPALRPDGRDLLFGGAGTDIARGDAGDLASTGHAEDADVIAGDNANIYRIVGTDGVDGGSFLHFEYDDFDPSLRRIVRAVEWVDYTPGGVDMDPTAADLGAADEIHGESGDDEIYGLLGNDVLFGEGQNDDVVGGTGHDWIAGGAGIDGLVGDDGRIATSRNVEARPNDPEALSEPLHGVLKLDAVDETIATPGDVQMAMIHPDGALKKTVNLTPFILGDGTDPDFDPTSADDILYGGFGDDFVHGGPGDDAISGAEALSDYYAVPAHPRSGDVLGFGKVRTGEFAAYDEFHPRRKILVDADGVFTTPDDPTAREFLLNFDASEGESTGDVWSDGDDALFGDRGNDWIVGGTGRDHAYGGFGNDLINLDDDHDSTAGTPDPRANDVPDTDPSFEDIGFGGAGRDVLLANTGGDRLIDWAGEFNSYIVPFSAFGNFTVSRAVLPQLPEFLYDLSEADGADPTRAADTGSSAERNGEPEGEIGLVVQRDPEWRDQTGAPDDPQPGNIPGGARDTLRSANFNLGTAEGFAPDSGVFRVEGGRLEVEPEFLGGDAVSVFVVDETLPSYFELYATINGGKPLAGYKSNAFLVFDYQSETDFKFAGVNISLDKMQMGYRDADGWHVVEQTPSRLRPNTDYNLLLALNGSTASLVVDGTQVFSHAFAPRVDPDGFRYGLNVGMVGIGADNSISRIDNVAVRVLPPEITFEEAENFADGVADRFTSSPVGAWQIVDGRYAGSPAAGADAAQALVDLGLEQGLRPTSILELEASFATTELGGLVFDRYGPEDFKFAALLPETDQVVIGHHTARGGWVIDAEAPSAVEPGADHLLGIALKGTTVSVSVDGQIALGHVFNALIVDGDFGLLTGSEGASFDSFALRTDDAAFREPTSELLVAPFQGEGGGELTDAQLRPVLAEAVRRWESSLASIDAAFDSLRVEVVDLEGRILGRTIGDTVQIDLDAAGHGWFVDSTPWDDLEFAAVLDDGSRLAEISSPAVDAIDLLSVLLHELGHVAGLDHEGLGSDALDVGVRLDPTAIDGESDRLHRYDVRVLATLDDEAAASDYKFFEIRGLREVDRRLRSWIEAPGSVHEAPNLDGDENRTSTRRLGHPRFDAVRQARLQGVSELD